MRGDWDFLWGIALIAAILGFVWFGTCDTDCDAIDDPLDRDTCFEYERERRDF